MKVNLLLFTQTMHSLLCSSLPLQDALGVCEEILQTKNEKDFCKSLLVGINEGNTLSCVLQKYNGQIYPLYTALVQIGEETGALTEVFERLVEYLKVKKQMQHKLLQALAYPLIVLFTTFMVIMLLVFFVLPRLTDIFEAFTENAAGINIKTENIKMNLFITFYIIISGIIFVAICILLHKLNDRCAYHIDSFLLRLPVAKKLITVVQIQDFAFSMKLLTVTHFPLIQSLSYSAGVVTNLRLKKSLIKVCEGISRGESAGDCFAKDKIFPKYLTVWIKLAERNGNLTSVFTQISDYYSAANSEIVTNITTFAEPVLILLTGIVIIIFMAQVIIPVFNILGAL